MDDLDPARHVNRIFDGKKVHVRRAMCDTCIFRPGNLMHLEPGRVDEMVAGCGDEGAIPCHHHLYKGEEHEPVCAGFMKKHKNMILRLAELMGVIEWH